MSHIVDLRSGKHWLMHLKFPGGDKNMSVSVHEHVELELPPKSTRKPFFRCQEKKALET